MPNITHLISVFIALFSINAFANTGEGTTFLWVRTETLINSLKILAIIAFIVAISLTVKPVRKILYAIFLKFEIQIQKIIFFVKKFLNSKVITWIFNQILSIIRLFRFIPKDYGFLLFAAFAFFTAYSPATVFSFFGENSQENIGYIAFAVGVCTIASLIGLRITSVNKDNKKTIAFYYTLNIISAITITVYGLFLQQQGVGAVGVFAYSSSILGFWIYSLICTENRIDNKINLAFLALIMIITTLTIYSGNLSFFSDLDSFLTYIAVANAVLTLSLIWFYIFSDDIITEKKCKKITLFFILINAIFNGINANEFKAMTNYLITTAWGIAFFITLPIAFPMIKNIFSGKTAFSIGIVWSVLALNISYVNNIKAYISFVNLNHFYACLAFTALSILCCIVNFMYRHKNKLNVFKSTATLNLFLLAVCINNMIAFNSIIFAILVTISSLSLIFMVSERMDWGIKPAQSISLIMLVATLVIGQTIGFNEETKYIPVIVFFIFLPIWFKEWIEIFVITDTLHLTYLLTMVIISALFLIGGDMFAKNAIVNLVGCWFTLSIGILIFSLFLRLHMALGFFVAGFILYGLATLFEHGTFQIILNNITSIS